MKTTLGALNPFRYRGYVWDEETGLYYLMSRYYDGKIRRFINLDRQLEIELLGINGYVYCHNSPVVNADTSGRSSYYVVLNVYTPDDYENNAGHYDVSVISREGPVHYEYNGRTYSSEEWTFSYGPFNDGQGYVKMYEGGRAKKHERFVIFDDLTQEEFQEFIDWLINDFSTFEEVKNGVSYCKVRGGAWENYQKYSIENNAYCGAVAALYLLSLFSTRPMGETRKKLSPDVISLTVGLLSKAVYVTDHVMSKLKETFPRL